MGKDQNLLELLDIYIDLTEKQEEIINGLSRVVKEQAARIRNMETVYEYEHRENRI